MPSLLPTLGRAGANGLAGGFVWVAASSLLYGGANWSLAAAFAAAVAVVAVLLSFAGR